MHYCELDLVGFATTGQPICDSEFELHLNYIEYCEKHCPDMTLAIDDCANPTTFTHACS